MRWVVRITLACPEGVIHRQVQRVLIVVMMRMVMSMDMTSVVRMAAMSQNHRARVLVVRQMQRHYERLHDQANRHQHSEELRKRRVACSQEHHSGRTAHRSRAVSAAPDPTLEPGACPQRVASSASSSPKSGGPSAAARHCHK
jgi:hypothetical protein